MARRTRSRKPSHSAPATGVNVAIAETADCRHSRRAQFPRHHGRAAVWIDLDISTLPLTEEMARTFGSLGHPHLEQLAQLPETGIAERFGRTASICNSLASGAIHRPLRDFQPRHHVRRTHRAGSSRQPARAAAVSDRAPAQRSMRKAGSRIAMAANEVTIRLELENQTEHMRTLRLPVPMRESKALLKLLQMDLEAHPPQAATQALSLSAQTRAPAHRPKRNLSPRHPRPGQTGADAWPASAASSAKTTSASPSSWTRIIRILSALSRASRKSPLPRHRPTMQAFRYFRPPLPATVELHHNRPARIAASGIHGKILNAAGPWRTSGDWWTTTAWNRDEWDIALIQRRLYRIYREPDQTGSSKAPMTERSGQSLNPYNRDSRPYVELHARSAFSFLEGSSVPEELVARAAELDIPAMAILDRDNVSGARALPHGREKSRHPRAHRRRNHLHRRPPLSAAGRKSHRLPEPLPPDHPHEAARQKRRRRGHTGRARRILAKAWSACAPRPDQRVPRSLRRKKRLRRTAAPLQPRRGSPQPGPHRFRARTSACRWSPPTASSHATPAIARSARRPHLRPPQSHNPRSRPPARHQLRAPSQKRAGNGAPLRRSSRSHRQHARALRSPAIHARRSRLPIPALPRAARRNHEFVPAQAHRRRRDATAIIPSPSICAAAPAARSSASWR